MTDQSFAKPPGLLASGARRLLRARWWLVLQLVGIALFIALGLLWTRIPEKTTLQVILTFVVPVLLVTGFLSLQAAHLRSLLRPLMPASEPVRPPASFTFGALTLLLWIAIGWILWSLLDRFDAHTFEWASYLNSRFHPEARARIFTYPHLLQGLDYAAWFLRWVAVPALLIPLGCTAFYGLRRAPWGRILRTWSSWRWWPAVLLLALLGGALPQTFFHADPTGPVNAQITRVIVKLAAAYLLAVLCWTLALAWAAALIAPPPAESEASPTTEPNPLEGRPLPMGPVNDNLGGNA